jgi:sugar/nucleoside kinase (ribokinase family)
MGALGAVHYDYKYDLSVPKLENVNTCGAGDAFTVGMVAELLNGSSIDDSISCGNVLANIKCRSGFISLADERLSNEALLNIVGEVEKDLHLFY